MDPSNFLLQKKTFKNYSKIVSALSPPIVLPPNSADWILSVAPAFSALLCAPLGFSYPCTRALGGYSELPTSEFTESPRQALTVDGEGGRCAGKCEKAGGTLGYALIGTQEPC